MDIDGMNVAELRAELKRRHLDANGRKATLKQRLTNAMQQQQQQQQSEIVQTETAQQQQQQQHSEDEPAIASEEGPAITPAQQQP